MRRLVCFLFHPPFRWWQFRTDGEGIVEITCARCGLGWTHLKGKR